MTYKYLPSNIPQILRDAGLKVVEVDGWQRRGTDSGGFDPVGVLCHHTATPRSLSIAGTIDLLVRGRTDLKGPLCQFGLGRDGTVYVIAGGRAHHAGKARASGTVAAGDGNTLYIGIEAFNDGVGEPWPAVQYEAYVLLAATLCREVTGNSAQTVRAHRETSVTGKIDVRFDMNIFRQRVADLLAGKKPPAPRPPALPAVSLARVQKAARVPLWRLALDSKTRADRAKVIAALKAEKCPTYRAWQVRLGYKGADADGVPGLASLSELGKRHGWRVVA